MDKPAVSRKINRLTGGHPEEMFCYRVYIQQRIWGGFWLPLGHAIDLAFFVSRRQRQHVRATYLAQRREDAKATQRSTRSSQEAERTQPTSPTLVETVPGTTQEGVELWETNVTDPAATSTTCQTWQYPRKCTSARSPSSTSTAASSASSNITSSASGEKDYETPRTLSERSVQ